MSICLKINEKVYDLSNVSNLDELFEIKDFFYHLRGKGANGVDYGKDSPFILIYGITGFVDHAYKMKHIPTFSYTGLIYLPGNNFELSYNVLVDEIEMGRGKPNSFGVYPADFLEKRIFLTKNQDLIERIKGFAAFNAEKSKNQPRRKYKKRPEVKLK